MTVIANPARRAMGGYQGVLRVSNWILAGLIPLGFAWFAVQYVGHVVTIRNVDYFQFVELAQRLDTSTPATWVNGAHPNGYPLLIRWALDGGLDAVQIGHALSVVGGMLLLVSAYLIAHQLTANRWLALLTEAFLACTGYFLYFGTMEGSDMLSAGLQAMALALLIGLTTRGRDYLVAGTLAGLAYVVRYTAAVTTALCLVFLVGRALVRRERRLWVVAALYLAGFLLGAALQLVPSAFVTGNPFYSVRGRDLWWHVEGLSNFATQWRLAPEDVSVLSIFLADPQRFIGHWWDVAQSFWVDSSQLLLDTPLRLLTQAGLLFTLLAGRDIAVGKRALLAVYVVGLLVALALIRYDARFLVVLLPILAFGVVYFLQAIVPHRLSIGRTTIPVAGLVLVALLGWASAIPFGYLRVAPKSSEDVLTVTNTLRAAGMESPQQVLSSSIPLHDASVPARTRYTQSYWATPEVNEHDGLLRAADEAGYRFILYDAETGLKAHPGLEPLLNPNSRPSRLTPLWIPQDRHTVLYRVEQVPAAPARTSGAQLEGGILLEGSDLYAHLDVPERSAWRIGLYLYWRALQPISESYKVFVHVLNAQNELVAQDDSLPVLWTYPTNSWQVGETVVDFHSLMLPPGLPPGSYVVQVGMYDETTMRRLIVGSGEATGDDKIILARFTLDMNGEGRIE